MTGRPEESRSGKCTVLAIDFAPLFEMLSPRCASIDLMCGRAGDHGWPGIVAWEAFLLALSAEELSVCERNGLQYAAEALRCRMPHDLRTLCDAVASVASTLGRTGVGESGGCSPSCTWKLNAKKAKQVGALIDAVAARLDLRAVHRVVDVGCGKGHLTEQLRVVLGVPVLGLDIDAALIETARTLYPMAEFEVCDIVRQGLPIRTGDLIVGLHPCGALGEAVVTAVAAHGGAALLMVSCCWHKQHAPVRSPLSRAGKAAGLTIPTKALKKASMRLDCSTTVRSRRSRHEMRELLRLRGVDEAVISGRHEMSGVHSKWAERGLSLLAAEVLRARGMEPPTEEEIEEATTRAAGQFEQMRRLSLLEGLFGELLELLLTLDRAIALDNAGLSVCVFKAFATKDSDRNLAILADRPHAPIAASVMSSLHPL